MSIEPILSVENRARIDAIASRSGLTAADVVADALENGHSLKWQEQFLAKVAKGVETADRGDFASEAEVERVMTKCRPSSGRRLPSTISI